MNKFFDLDKKIVVLTGSSGGIGKSICKGLLEANATIYGFDNKPSKIENKMYTHFECDLTDFNRFNFFCDKIFAKESRIDVLINNAGVTIPSKNNGAYQINDWQKTIEINLTTPFFCSQIIKDYMKNNNSGSIINITSISAELGFPNNPAYGASKGGLKSLSKSLAAEWAEFGIRVNCIGPGYIGEGMTQKSFSDEDIREHRESMMMIKKWNTSNEVANTCVFLSSNAATYITGQDIYVDGGWTVKGFPDNK